MTELFYFFLSRLRASFLSFFVILTLTFFLMKLVPGDPFMGERGLPPEVHKVLMEHYGLDKPVLQQYAIYLKQIFTGDLGISLIHHKRSVNDIINVSFPISAVLGLEALGIALPLGIGFGVWMGLRQKGWMDRTGLLIFALMLSIPSFILAPLLQYFLGIKLHLFPVARWGTLAQSVLPAISLAAMPVAFLAKLVRTNVLEVLREDYIITAVAKGLPPRKIVSTHVLKNALTPLLGYIGQLAANILVGSFVIEKVYGIPGLGYWFVNSIANRDYPVIMGVTVLYSAVLLTVMLASDIIQALWDPRLLLREKEALA